MLLLSPLIISTSGANISHLTHSDHTKLVTYAVPTDVTHLKGFKLRAEPTGLNTVWGSTAGGRNHSSARQMSLSPTGGSVLSRWTFFFLAVRPTSCLVGVSANRQRLFSKQCQQLRRPPAIYCPAGFLPVTSRSNIYCRCIE